MRQKVWQRQKKESLQHDTDDSFIHEDEINLSFVGVLFTLWFDGEGGIDSIHPLFTCESNWRGYFFILLNGKYSQLKPFKMSSIGCENISLKSWIESIPPPHNPSKLRLKVITVIQKMFRIPRHIFCFFIKFSMRRAIIRQKKESVSYLGMLQKKFFS